jgi:LysR family hydrogen peroxide-inducible transcriptional activator
MASININLRDLRYLVALADFRHFGKAASACFVSQPTLSAQLKKLESNLGVQLVERTRRQVRLTPIGEEIAGRARRTLKDVEEIWEAARRAQDPLTGPLQLGLIPTLGPYLLPYVVPAIRDRYPQLELMLYEDQTERLLSRLRAGELDAAIVALPSVSRGLEEIPLFTETFMVALPDNHPLARKKTVRVKDLDGETLLLLEDGHCLREQALEVCHSVNAMERPGFRATSLETLRHMVAAGAGITLLPALAVPPGESLGAEPTRSAVIIRPFATPAPSRTLGIVYRHEAARRRAIEAVAETVRDIMVGVLAKRR